MLTAMLMPLTRLYEFWNQCDAVDVSLPSFRLRRSREINSALEMCPVQKSSESAATTIPNKIENVMAIAAGIISTAIIHAGTRAYLYVIPFVARKAAAAG